MVHYKYAPVKQGDFGMLATHASDKTLASNFRHLLRFIVRFGNLWLLTPIASFSSNVDQCNTLSVTTNNRHIGCTSPNQCTLVRNKHHFILVSHLDSANNTSIASRCLNRNNARTTSCACCRYSSSCKCACHSLFLWLSK